MNVKLLFKMVFLIIVLLLLVLMGMYNREWVAFRLPPLLNEKVSLQAAIMYFAFFAVGLLTGTILTAGSGGRKGGGKSEKESK
jgi:hypothetical protein